MFGQALARRPQSEWLGKGREVPFLLGMDLAYRLVVPRTIALRGLCYVLCKEGPRCFGEIEE